MINQSALPTVALTTTRTGVSNKANEMGMRVMQARAYAKRGEQYLLIKSPPASGKSRALMFIALDKLHNQGVGKSIIVVPERSIGGSFADEALSQHGFWADWVVKPKWNLCNAPGRDDEEVSSSKVKNVGEFLMSDDRILVCTHATFRFAFEALGVAAFDECLIAIDEFHHVSSNPTAKMGVHTRELISQGKAHIVAMTGSYFRGDAIAILSPEDEAKFETVTYTYYEQLNGYDYLKSLAIGYSFYTGSYIDAISKVLDTSLKTILHIPNVNSSAALGDKYKEVEDIVAGIGILEGVDPQTGFWLVKQIDGKTLKIADLVDNDATKRDRVISSLKDPRQKNNRDHVDIIIALGMAKEGFDWIWCEHALTIGYRNSLTEIIQIIGRATRDAPGKELARFTNLIAEPDASQGAVVNAVNDTLKAIAASLLMEQVLAPRFEFTPKDSGAKDGYDYGAQGYVEGKTNIGFDQTSGQFHFEIKGLAVPQSSEATRICREDLNEVVAAFVQDKPTMERGLFDRENTVPEELTQLQMGKIVRDRYPNLSEEDQEAIRQHAIAALNLTQQAKKAAAAVVAGDEIAANTAFIDGIRRFAMDVRELDIDLIDQINPFDAAYGVLAKAMNENTLRQVEAAMRAKRVNIPYEEARALALRARQFKQDKGRVPEITSQDAWERRLAEGVAALAKHHAARAANG